jgi:hypothetical protein
VLPIPGVTQIELTNGGRIRHLRDPAGHTFVEQLESYDHAARSYSYSIVTSPISVINYLATITVGPAGGGPGSQIEWFATFTAVEITSEEAESIFNEIFSEGLKGLAHALSPARLSDPAA